MGTEDDRGLEVHENGEWALENAFARLRTAEGVFASRTFPRVPLGRPHIFRVAHLFWPTPCQSPGSIILGVLSRKPWPEVYGQIHRIIFRGDAVRPESEYAPSKAIAVNEILSWTGDQPRRVWRVIRQINAVIAWCEKRAEGRKRAAAEILRQQKPWADKIASEVLVEELAGAVAKQPAEFIKVQSPGESPQYIPIFKTEEK